MNRFPPLDNLAVLRTRVFVNRGWIPINCTEWSHPQGIQTTVGIVQDWEKVATIQTSDSYN